MKKKLLLLLFLCPIFLIYLTACNRSQESYTLSTNQTLVKDSDLTSYNDKISSLIKVSPNEYHEIQNQNQISFIYFGRESCPYCREFVNSLDLVLKEADSNFEIYYIDTENREEETLVKLRNELNIEFVPAFLRVGNGKTDYLNENTESISNFLNEH